MRETVRATNHMSKQPQRNTSFEHRSRMSLEEAKQVLARANHLARHLLDNRDGTYSVFFHSDEVRCDYCDERTQKFSEGFRGEDLLFTIHAAKVNAYENQSEGFLPCASA